MKKIKKIFSAVETMDGAGVRLNRVFGFNEIPEFDPFLLLDYFSTDNPRDIEKGFPWHPHRGIETITYILKGEVEHQDSLGNKGVIGPSEVQWMTAGSGIIHQEMPVTAGGKGMEGFQLWLNLKSADKMTYPQYGDIKADMIRTVVEPGLTVKVIGGTYGKTEGPVRRDSLGVVLLDLDMQAGTEYTHEPGEGTNTFIFVYKGSGMFGEPAEKVSQKQAAVFNGEGGIRIKAGENMRFLIFEGYPLREPISWGGPIVMNTREELRTAFREYDDGNFIKHKQGNDG
ncbi:MAG: pirin family protein [Clostridia bacterium]